MQRIGIIGENSAEYVKKILECWAQNNSVVLMDWRVPLDKAIEIMREIGVSKIYVEDMFIKNVQDNNILCVPFKSENQKCTELSPSIFKMYKPNYSEDEAVVLFSSGTTGKAKGISLSHRAITNNVNSIAKKTGISERSSILIFKSLAYSSSLVGELLLGIKYKCRTVLAKSLLTPRSILKCLDEFKIEYTFMNPTLLKIYSKAAIGYKLSRLKVIYVYGAGASADTIMKAQKAFPYTDILCGYGLSEAGPRVTMQQPGDNQKGYNGSSGKVLDGVEIVIADEKGNKKSTGECGIIHVKTISAFTAYANGEQMRESYYKGWINTGDIGYLDKENNLYVIGRGDNSCLVGAHIVYLEEIEEKINTLQGIEDCITMCIQDEIYGQSIICYYTGELLSEKNIRKELSMLLAPYEIPKKIVHIKKIPLTINGKKIRSLHNNFTN